MRENIAQDYPRDGEVDDRISEVENRKVEFIMPKNIIHHALAEKSIDEIAKSTAND